MSVEITEVEGLQELQVPVSGPGDVTRMFMITGVALVTVQAWANTPETETTTEELRLTVGPELGITFRRAVATVALADVSFSETDSSPAPSWGRVSVGSVDASFDDDSGRARLTFSLTAVAQAGVATTERVSFQVTVLAA